MKNGTKTKDRDEGTTIIPIIGLVIISIILIGFFTPLSSYNPFLSHQEQKESVVIENGDEYDIHYEWTFKGMVWTYDSKIPISLYRKFKEKTRTADYASYIKDPEDDAWISELAERFEEASEEQNLNGYQTVSLVLSFVQSMRYTSDKVSSGFDEYPRYPIETIVDQGGDCEDSSILFSSIVRAMGYGTVLIVLEKEKHMGTGVKISRELVQDWNRGYPLTYYSKNDSIYAYCETTGSGWEFGEMSEKIENREASIIEVF